MSTPCLYMCACGAFNPEFKYCLRCNGHFGAPNCECGRPTRGIKVKKCAECRNGKKAQQKRPAEKSPDEAFVKKMTAMANRVDARVEKRADELMTLIEYGESIAPLDRVPSNDTPPSNVGNSQ